MHRVGDEICSFAAAVCGKFETAQPIQEFTMLSAARNFSSLRLILAVALVILFCAGAALTIVGGMPGGADVIVLQD